MSPIRLLPAALLALVPLAGCAAGQHDVTSGEHATPWVADVDVGPVAVRAVTLVPAISVQTASSPSGAPTATSSAPATTPSPSAVPASGGAQAYLTMTLVSSVEDTLTGASLSNGGTVTPTGGSAGSLTVRPQQALIISDPETATSGGPALGVTGLTQPLQLGTTVKVTLTFQKAGSVTLAVPVRDPAVA